MQIDLRNCDTVVINLAEALDRRAHMTRLCQELELDCRWLEAIKCSPGPIGCGLSHVAALRSGLSGRPLLVLEDDIAATEDFDPVVTIPDDADALYIGTSHFGGLEAYNFLPSLDSIAADHYSSDLLRTYNMMSTHAILYLSDRYRRAAEEAMISAVAVQRLPPDHGLAAIQSRFSVYALSRPMVYQATEFQEPYSTVESATRPPVTVHPIGATLVTYPADGARLVRLVRKGHALTWLFADDEGE
jgi:hypothetical protein